MEDGKKFWFPAKPYGAGWGWGWPATWQGWLVFLTYFALVLGGGICLAPRSGPVFFLFIALISWLFLAICIWKGEPQHKKP